MNGSERKAGGRRKTLLKLALGALLCGAGSVHAKFGASDYYRDAQSRFGEKDYRGALIQLKNAVTKDPDDVAVALLMGRTYIELRQGVYAVQALRQALDKGADPNLVLPLLARAYYLRGDYLEVIGDERALTLPDPQRGEFLTVQGHAYLALNRDVDAERAFNEAARLLPHKAEPIAGRALVMLARNKREAAEDLADMALAEDPGSPEGWFMKGETRRMGGDQNAAVTHYDRAIALAANHYDARVGRAMSLIGLGRDRDALADLDVVLDVMEEHTQALYLKLVVGTRLNDAELIRKAAEQAQDALNRLDPKFIRSHQPTLLLAGALRLAQKQYADAADLFGQYLRQHPENAFIRRLLGALLLDHQKRPDAAIDMLEPALAYAPDDPEIRLLLGSAYLRRGQYAKAAAALEKAAESLPDRAEVQSRLALAHFALGDAERTRETLKTALEKDSGNIEASLLLAEIADREGDYDTALQRAEAVAKLQPGNPIPHNLTGIALAGKGRYGEARAAFERVLALDPKFEPALRNLAKLHLQQGDTAAAADSYRKLLEKLPGDVDILAQLSKLAEGENRLEDAVSWLEQIRPARREDAAAQARLIDLYLRLQQPEMALGTAERLMRIDRGNFAVMLGMGRAKLALGRTAEARDTFRTLALYSGKSPEQLVTVAKYQTRLDDTEGAAKTLAQALSVSPDYLPAHAEGVLMDMKAGRFDQALRRVGTLREKYPKSPIGDLLAGDVLSRLGKPGEALAAYRAALAKDDSPTFVIRRYQARKAAEGAEPALRELEQWVEAHPNQPAGSYLRAIAYLDAGRFDEAVGLHEKALKALPDNPELLNNLAWLLHRKGDPRALEPAERAARLAPDEPAILDTLGWILAERGEPARALKYLRQAEAGAKGDPSIRYHLAVVLDKLGRPNEAQEQLRAALKPGAEFEERSRARELLQRLSGK